MLRAQSKLPLVALSVDINYVNTEHNNSKDIRFCITWISISWMNGIMINLKEIHESIPLSFSYVCK